MKRRKFVKTEVGNGFYSLDMTADYLNTTGVTVVRWLEDPKKRFPAPAKTISVRRYWREGQIKSWAKRLG